VLMTSNIRSKCICSIAGRRSNRHWSVRDCIHLDLRCEFSQFARNFPYSDTSTCTSRRSSEHKWMNKRSHRCISSMQYSLCLLPAFRVVHSQCNNSDRSGNIHIQVFRGSHDINGSTA
ncbi:hypothetical protein PFISCL1PPCAC_5704, partial [Pristionchus fissidentatus]